MTTETSETNIEEKPKRPYTVGEEIANSVTHGVGAVLAVSALTILVVFSALSRDAVKLAASITYSVALTLEYAASTLYHAFPQPKVKHVFKILDHCGIYLLIAGTYTPFCLVTLRGNGGVRLFALVWALALAGIALEAFWVYRPRWLSAVIYLGLGWLVVLAIGPLTKAMPSPGLWLLVAGGLSYTLGTVFYVLKKISYMHAVWHIFVLAGSILHFLAVLLFVVL
ncbi:MAG: hemolysin III family protein [Coriobacteriia bacterium]|nr:hemolysin III family protein [Coriobacteriia bacterium]